MQLYSFTLYQLLFICSLISTQCRLIQIHRLGRSMYVNAIYKKINPLCYLFILSISKHITYIFSTGSKKTSRNLAWFKIIYSLITPKYVVKTVVIQSFLRGFGVFVWREYLISKASSKRFFLKFLILPTIAAQRKIIGRAFSIYIFYGANLIAAILSIRKSKLYAMYVS